jgi:hypothetical protein
VINVSIGGWLKFLAITLRKNPSCRPFDKSQDKLRPASSLYLLEILTTTEETWIPACAGMTEWKKTIGIAELILSHAEGLNPSYGFSLSVFPAKAGIQVLSLRFRRQYST